MDVIQKNNLINNSMSKIRIKNTKFLNTLARNARGDAVEKVSEVIKLYSESKVPQIITAENMIIDLIYNTKKQIHTKPLYCINNCSTTSNAHYSHILKLSIWIILVDKETNYLH